MSVVTIFYMVTVCVMFSGCAAKRQQEDSCNKKGKNPPVPVMLESPFNVALYSDLPFLPSLQNTKVLKLDNRRSVFEMQSAIDYVQAVAYIKDISESLGWRLIDDFLLKDHFYATFDRPTKRMIIHVQQQSTCFGQSLVMVRMAVSILQ